jgi:hypothetical protein
MIGTRGGSSPGPDSLAIEAALQASVSSEGGPWDLVVDGGRLLPTENLSGAASWLGHSDQVVVVVHRDAPSILNVRQHAQTLADRHESVVGLVIVGGGRLRNAAIEEFTGIPIVGEVPIDLRAAHAVSGGGGANRRLSRSSLVVSARRLAEALARPSHKDEKGTHAVNGDAEHDPVSPATTPAPRRAPRRLTGLHQLGGVVSQGRLHPPPSKDGAGQGIHPAPGEHDVQQEDLGVERGPSPRFSNEHETEAIRSEPVR